MVNINSFENGQVVQEKKKGSTNMNSSLYEMTMEIISTYDS